MAEDCGSPASLSIPGMLTSNAPVPVQPHRGGVLYAGAQKSPALRLRIGVTAIEKTHFILYNVSNQINRRGYLP